MNFSFTARLQRCSGSCSEICVNLMLGGAVSWCLRCISSGTNVYCAVEGSAQRWIELDSRLHCGATPAKMKAVGLFCVCAAQSLKCAGACLHILWNRWYSQSFCHYRGQRWQHGVKGLRRDINNKCKRLTYLQMNRPVQDLFDDRESLVVTRWARACHVYKGSGSFVSCQTDVRTKIKNSPKKLLFVVLFDQWGGGLGGDIWWEWRIKGMNWNMAREV